jgi:hypothetical protein
MPAKQIKLFQTVFIFILITAISSCVAVPATDISYVGRCGVSPDHKTLKIVDVAKATNSYYSISGYVLTPILLPTTAIISGIYVLTNNAYYSGKNIVQC